MKNLIINTSYLLTGILVILVAMSSCRKDVDELVLFEEVNFGEKNDVRIAGRVTDEMGNPLNDVTVRLGSESQTSASGGIYYFRNASEFANITKISASKAGYFSEQKTLKIEDGTFRNIDFVLDEIEEGSPINTSGAIIELESGTITFGENLFIDENGSEYTEDAILRYRNYTPEEPEFFNNVPGSLRGIDSENREVSMDSYGVVYTTISGESAEVLRLGDDRFYKLSFNIPAEDQANAPVEVPLWLYDESLGLWLEYGVAFKVGQVYEAQVDTMGWFSVGNAYESADLTLQLVDSDERPLPFYDYIISIQNGKQIGQRKTTRDGLSRISVPVDKNLILRVSGQCSGSVISEQLLNPIAGTTDYGSLVIDEVETVSQVSAEVIPCTDFQNVLINYGDKLFPISEESAFSQTLEACDDVLNLNFIDLGEDESIEVQMDAVSVVDFGTVEICERQEAEFISYRISGVFNEITENDSLSLFSDNAGQTYKLTGISNMDTIRLGIEFESLESGSRPILYNPDEGLEYFFINSYGLISFPPNNSITITQPAFNPGDRCEGNFEGIFLDDEDVERTYTGSFSVNLK